MNQDLDGPLPELAEKPWWKEYDVPRAINSSMLEKTFFSQSVSLHTSLKTVLLVVKL